MLATPRFGLCIVVLVVVATTSCGAKRDAAEIDGMVTTVVDKTKAVVKEGNFNMADLLLVAAQGLRLEQSLILTPSESRSKEDVDAMARLASENHYDRWLALALSESQRQRLGELRAKYRYMPEEALRARGLLR